ncbi:MAG: GH116 family glycosyl-hydrolase, partial [Kiritimatiellae bacterium]|nr:GH116 family glycosyl-hydrolase [Kiritimatiellia bacterium]
MSTNGCCCAGRCRPDVPFSVSRREFLHSVAMGSAGLVMLSANTTSAMGMSRLAPLKLPDTWRYPVTPPRVYKGPNLEAVAMPIGGIGTGTVWLDGQGRLSIWQIFNNFGENRIPDSFFAVKAKIGGKSPVVRVIQTVPEEPLQPVQSLDYEGGYPIARLDFKDSELPVSLRMEAFNPFIPTDAANSSIPCAMFRFTIKNTTATAAEISLISTCQNAIGSSGNPGINGVKFAGYGRNRNRVVRERNFVALAMEKAIEPVETCPVKVRARSGETVPGPEMQWYSRMDGFSSPVVETLTRITKGGGIAMAASVQHAFFTEINTMRKSPDELSWKRTIFEDFEKNSYDGWTVTGDAFGKAPSAGTNPGQQKVSGFAGKQLVNTFLPNDKSQGILTSKPFRIEKRYIGFLVGGGRHDKQTCVNLKVGDKIVRTVTGKNNEALEVTSWDVLNLKGQEAIIEIVDRNSEGWGHVNVDQIVFSDIPAELFLQKDGSYRELAKTIALSFSSAEIGTLDAGAKPVLTADAPTSLKHIADSWQVTTYTRLVGFRNNEGGYRVLVTAPNGDPLIIEGPMGKGHVVLVLAKDLPWSWATSLFVSAGNLSLKKGEKIVPALPGWGTMALVALDDKAVGYPRWTKREEIIEGLAAGEDSGESPAGETFNGALAVPFTLKAGQERTVTFMLTWHFPNVTRFKHEGNFYSRRWPDAMEVARHVADNTEALWQRTRLYHETL